MGALDPLEAHAPTGPTGPIASIESEHAVLGALLLDNSVYDRIGDMVAIDDFTLTENRVIFQAISGLILAAQQADVVTVFERLQSTGAKIKRPLQYLNELVQSTPSAAKNDIRPHVTDRKAGCRRFLKSSSQSRPS